MMAQETATVLPGLNYAFRLFANGRVEELSTEQPMPQIQDSALWLHFDLADPRASQSIESIPDLTDSAKTLLATNYEQQQLYADDTCIYGVFVDLLGAPNNEPEEIHFVQFAVTKSLFITSARSKLSEVDSFRQDIERGAKVFSTAALVETIVDYIIDTVENYTKALAEKLDDIEEKVLFDEPGDQRRVLVEVRRATIRLSRQVSASLSLIRRFEHENARLGTSPLHLATDRMGQRLDWLNSELVSVRERAHLLQDEVMLRTADQTNRHLQVLAIVATVFLPATLIAGIFGMNVKGLPLTETSGGFFWSMILLIGASALVYWLLKRSGILKS
jgi:zinc transporter